MSMLLLGIAFPAYPLWHPSQAMPRTLTCMLCAPASAGALPRALVAGAARPEGPPTAAEVGGLPWQAMQEPENEPTGLLWKWQELQTAGSVLACWSG